MRPPHLSSLSMAMCSASLMALHMLSACVAPPAPPPSSVCSPRLLLLVGLPALLPLAMVLLLGPLLMRGRGVAAVLLVRAVAWHGVGAHALHGTDGAPLAQGCCAAEPSAASTAFGRLPVVLCRAARSEEASSSMGQPL